MQMLSNPVMTPTSCLYDDLQNPRNRTQLTSSQKAPSVLITNTMETQSYEQEAHEKSHMTD